MDRLKRYFLDGVSSNNLETMGMEVETQFVNDSGTPIGKDVSQKMFSYMLSRSWSVKTVKNGLITCLVDSKGNTFSYELGRQNIELSGMPLKVDRVLENTSSCLTQLYEAGEKYGAYPLLEPILLGVEDLLVIPDERDATWLKLDGREALAPLARTSSVQFTFSVLPESAVTMLNRLGKQIKSFLGDYPQEAVWKEYIKSSLAGYRTDRYGGPLYFWSLEDYCRKIILNDVVSDGRLVPYNSTKDLDISLYLRSIWWYFRLKRYGESLCIEVRPLPRRSDAKFESQLEMVLRIVS